MKISENLQILNTAKQDIKAAIIEKGQEVGDNMNEYAEAIDNISGGGADDANYLCFEALEDSTISLNNVGGNLPNVEYSFDKKSWTTWDYSNIELSAGNKVYMRGDNPYGFCISDDVRSSFAGTGLVDLTGKLVFLLNKNGIEPSEYPEGKLFETLFTGNTSIHKTHLVLPNCSNTNVYAQMYRRCTNLVECNDEINIAYSENSGVGVFYRYLSECTSLVKAPSLNMLVIGTGWYLYMFYGCTSLKEAPYLKVKTLVSTCMTSMFQNCSSLQYIKAEFTTTPSSSYSSNWVSGVASTGCFIKAKDATWTSKGTSACPSGWTLITSAS